VWSTVIIIVVSIKNVHCSTELVMSRSKIMWSALNLVIGKV